MEEREENKKMVGLVHHDNIRNNGFTAQRQQSENQQVQESNGQELPVQEGQVPLQDEQNGFNESDQVSFADAPEPEQPKVHEITEADLHSLYESLEEILALLNTYDSSVITEVKQLKARMEAYAESLKLLEGKALTDDDIKQVKKIASDVTNIYNRLNSIEPAINNMQNSISNTEELIRSVQETVGLHEEEINKIKEQNTHLSDEIERNAKDIGQHDRSIADINEKIELLNKNKNEIASIINEMEEKIDKLDRVVKGAKIDEIETFQQEIRQEIFSIKEKMEIMNSSISNLDHSVQEMWGIVKSISGKDFDKINQIVEKPITHQNTDTKQKVNTEQVVKNKEIISKIQDLGLEIYIDDDSNIQNKFSSVKTTTVPEKADVFILPLSKVKSLIANHTFNGKYANKVVIAVNLPGEQITTDDLFLSHNYPFLRILQFSIPLKLLYSTLSQLKKPYMRKKEEIIQKQKQEQEIEDDENEDAFNIFRKNSGSAD
jgi:chromosome segregation ATPase